MRATLLLGGWLFLLASGNVPAGESTTQDSVAIPPPIERQVWRGEPIQVRLPLGVERIVNFPDAQSLRTGLIGGPVPGLRIQPLDARLYLVAQQPFERTRLLVQSQGASVLLDLTVDEENAEDLGNLEILLASGQVANQDEPDSAVTQKTLPQPVGFVALVRHAAQTLYAPERLIPREGRIVRVPLRLRGQALDLVHGGKIQAIPHAAWRGSGPHGPLWVTAVLLRNLDKNGINLDPRYLRGQWRAAVFQHGHLAQAGREEDLTTAYLVSDRPFNATLGAIAATTPQRKTVP